MYHSGYEKYESSTGRRFFPPTSVAGAFSRSEICGSGPTGGFTKAHLSQNTATNKINAPRQIRKNGSNLRFRKCLNFSRIARSSHREIAAPFCREHENGRVNQ